MPWRSAVRPDLALDIRETSHTSAGMAAYTRALRRELPRVAPDLTLVEVGTGDNFDLAEQIGLPLTLARLRPRLAHFPTPFVPRFVPVPYIVTVHDLIDLEFPQWAKPKVGPYWRALVSPVLRGARAVITDDQATVALLERHCGVSPNRVRVVPLGVDAPNPLPAPRMHPRPYIFYAGNRRPHKDLRTLVEAWRGLPEESACDLLLTGDDDGDPALAGTVALGTLDERALWSAYRGAAAYVQPSLREGFGLPLLEAVRAGTPAIGTMTGTPQALAPFVRRYEAGDAGGLRALLVSALRDPSAHSRAERAREETVGLTWAATASATAAVYREVLR